MRIIIVYFRSVFLISCTVIFTASFSIVAANVAKAQTSEELKLQRLSDEVERLGRDMSIVQKQLFKEPQRKISLFGGNDNDSPKTQVRIDEIEQQIRELNGKIEEYQFQTKLIADKLDKIIADIDYRLDSLETKQAQESQILKLGEQEQLQQGFKTGFLGDDNKSKPLEKNDPKEDYENAFSLLRKAKYEQAAAAFEKFTRNHENSDLLPDAFYWLGESYYVDANYEKSAVYFLKAYQKSPRGKKAADSLYKLASSLGKLERTKEACTTFAKLGKEFTDLSDYLKDKISTDKKAFKC